GLVSKLDLETLQHQFTNRATEQGLGIKLTGLQQKGAETRERVGATKRGQNISAQSQAAGRVQRERASQRTAETSRLNKQAELNYKETHPSGKATNAPKAPSPAEGRKYMANISKAEAIAHQQGVSGKTTAKRLGEVRKYLQGLGYNGDQVSAAMNLAYY